MLVAVGCWWRSRMTKNLAVKSFVSRPCSIQLLPDDADSSVLCDVPNEVTRAAIEGMRNAQLP
jgi:hypothetical protein